jgi:uncharacterized protein
MKMREQFMNGLKEAMKGGDKSRVAAIRLIQAALKDKDIELRGLGKGQATDEDIMALLQKMVKQRQESLDIYTKAGRADLATIEQGEIEIIGSFLPKQMSESEIGDAVSAAIGETGAAGIKDMGKVVAALKARFAGRMDFGKASQMVKAQLSG